MKERNCPKCKHWRYDRQRHWCAIDHDKLTFTSQDLIGTPNKAMLECYYFEEE